MNPQLVFVTSLFTSRIFWTQVIALVALIVTAAGFHPDILSQANQAELVGLVDALMTTIFRVTGTNGPVSLKAPIRRPPAPVDVPPGRHTLTITAPLTSNQHPGIELLPR